VLYLSDEEMQNLDINDDEKWRVVKFEKNGNDWISWLHEREWRKKGDLRLPKENIGVLVKDSADAAKLRALLDKNEGKPFLCKPKAILPLVVVCQGLRSS